MPNFRKLVNQLDVAGELLRVTTSVEPRFELPALLKQAEARRKGILFESVTGSQFPVAGGLLTDAKRFAQGLGLPEPAGFTRKDHVALTVQAMAKPLAPKVLEAGPAHEVIVRGRDIDLAAIPVPTCFEGDTGPFMTAAVGVSRNPANGVLNAGFYRILITGRDQLVVSVGPGSDLLQYFAANKAAGRNTQIALVIGGDPAFMMAASAKVPADVSELDVAGGFAGTPLEVIKCVTSDLLVPADAEFVIEVEIDHTIEAPNVMGEFGDLYGTTLGQGGSVVAITHRHDAIFHTIMGGAGREHNSLGFIILYDIEPELRRQLAETHPEVEDVRVLFEPPKMGQTGEIYMSITPGSAFDAKALARHIFGLHCGRFDVARVIRKIVFTDTDIDLKSNQEITWAINNRANDKSRHLFFDDLALPGLDLRRAIDTVMLPEDRERLRRLVIPGADKFRLDDYS